MISQNDDPGGLGGKMNLFKVGGRQGRPDGKAGTRGHHRQSGLNAFAKSKDAVWADFRQSHGPARDLAQHHARLCDIGFGDSVRCFIDVQVGSMNGNGDACMIANDGDQRRKSGFGFPVCQVGMELEVRTIRYSQSTVRQIIGYRCVFEGLGMGQNKGDFIGRVPIGFRGAGGLLSRW